jgi:hypothetical protein
MGHSAQRGRIRMRIYDHLAECLIGVTKLKQAPQQNPIVGESYGVGGSLPNRRFELPHGAIRLAGGNRMIGGRD